MKTKSLITALVGLCCSLGAVSTASAQSAAFLYNDGVGTPNAGSYTPGSSFTFSINLNFTSGGAINNLEGLSYWFQQNNASPFYFSITLRDSTGSLFTDLQTPSMSYPQNLAAFNPDDLGALLPFGPPALGSGNYLVASLTISIDPSAALGVYQIQNVTSGGRTSFLFNDLGIGFAIPASIYTITIIPNAVPEGLSTLVALGVVGGALLLLNHRRRATS